MFLFYLVRMSHSRFSRRQLLSSAAILTGASLLPACATNKTTEAVAKNTNKAFSFCLNTSTIMGQKVGLEREIEIAAEAGYDGIEIWIPTLNTFIDGGGKLSELKKKIDGLGIRVENAIGFAQWIVDDDSVREKALRQAKEEMELLAQLGCRRIAAPPAGVTEAETLDLDAAAARFRDLHVLGSEVGVIPQLEVWGFSKHLHKLSQVLYVAAECGHQNVRILPDVYHLYKGGSAFESLSLLASDAVEIFHMNDYPALPNQDDIGDKDRVYPGLGVAPLKQILSDLADSAHPKVLSLELFNRDYWKQDPFLVAKEGLRSMKEAVGLVEG